MSVTVLLSICVILLLLIIVWLVYRSRKMMRHYILLMETLICLMEAGDPNLDGHSMHVYNIVSVFYDYLPGECQRKISRENLKLSALLHDIGKLGIPRSVITKRGKLTPAERDLIKKHPEISVEILKPLDFMAKVEDIIRCHHERVDGSGYLNLKGDSIPIEARIIAIADTYSALTMDRTYKPTLPYEDAIIELKQVAGTQLDEDLVRYFCEIPMHRLDDCLVSVLKITERYQKGILNNEGQA